MEKRTDIYDFNRLYHDYRQRYIRFARTYVRDTATAEDIVMDSLMYYWENRSVLPHQTNIPAYVLTIVKNRCINYLRREQKREEVERFISEYEAWELNVRISTLEACNPEQLFSEEIQSIIQKTLNSLGPGLLLRPHPHRPRAPPLLVLRGPRRVVLVRVGPGQGR